VELGDELLPHAGVELAAGVELLDPVLLVAHLRAELFGGELDDVGTDQRELLRQQPVAREVVEGRHEQALREVARGAEDDDHAGVAGRLTGLAGSRLGLRRLGPRLNHRGGHGSLRHGLFSRP
jgi:hypothetical protein